MKYKFELYLATFVIPIVLHIVLYGAQFDLENSFSSLTFSIAILLGYHLPKRMNKDKRLSILFLMLLSLSLGFVESLILSHPTPYFIRFIGQSLFTFIGTYCVGGGIQKREMRKAHDNV